MQIEQNAPPSPRQNGGWQCIVVLMLLMPHKGAGSISCPGYRADFRPHRCCGDPMPYGLPDSCTRRYSLPAACGCHRFVFVNLAAIGLIQGFGNIDKVAALAQRHVSQQVVDQLDAVILQAGLGILDPFLNAGGWTAHRSARSADFRGTCRSFFHNR